MDNWTSPPDALDLDTDHVDVWRIHLDPKTDSVKRVESTLSTDEIERAAKFHFPKDRDRFLAAHISLRDILARYLQCQPGELTFSVNQYGKPALDNHKLEFNLSHSGDFALIAVAGQRKVGVDMECIRSDMEVENIAARNFSKSELSELMALPLEQRVTGFFNCWTRKEAYIKAHGLGLSFPLENFDVSLTPNEPAILRATRPDQREAAHWTLLALEINPNYAGALAVEAETVEYRFWDWDFLASL
jgi:4'-phosphopantetheinyl transferase